MSGRNHQNNGRGGPPRPPLLVPGQGAPLTITAVETEPPLAGSASVFLNGPLGPVMLIAGGFTKRQELAARFIAAHLQSPVVGTVTSESGVVQAALRLADLLLESTGQKPEETATSNPPEDPPAPESRIQLP